MRPVDWDDSPATDRPAMPVTSVNGCDAGSDAGRTTNRSVMQSDPGGSVDVGLSYFKIY